MDGKAFDDFFDSIGKQADQISKTTDAPITENGDAPETSLTDDEQRVVDEIESLCMNCHANGITRLLLTRIPFFREIIIMSFYCPHCSFKNTEIQSAGEIQQRGSRYELRLTTQADLSRQIVKSDSSTVKFIELDIEVPSGRGQLTNVEGLLSMILEDLGAAQEQRKEEQPEVYEKIEEILTKGRKMLDGSSFPFRLQIDDPAGNSWIEPDQKDGVGKWNHVSYARTASQNQALGLGDGTDADAPSDDKPSTDSTLTPATLQNPSLDENDDIIPNEVYSFPAHCPGCTRPCTTHMKMVDIPHFKQVVIMSTVCDSCGYRSNEVKTGGEVPALGRQITLHVRDSTDLARDILKSESCALECPELELQVNPGTLGGRFTTVEGLLTQVRGDLHAQIFDVGSGGDGMEGETASNWAKFFEGIDRAIAGEKKFTVILRDPLASSYVQNLCSPDKDPQIEEVDYERSVEEEEDLGLSDMKTENYGEGEGEAENEEAEVTKETKTKDEE